MLSSPELDRYLHHLTLHPTDHASPVPKNGREVLVAGEHFGPGEMVTVHVHPAHACSPLPEGEYPPAHRHDFIEFAFVWAGDCGMEVEEKPFRLELGDFVILDTNSAHRIFEKDETLLINLDIRTEFFNDAFFRHFETGDALADFFANTVYSEKAARRYLVFRTGNDPKIRQLFTMILQEYFSQEVCCRPIIESLVTILLIATVRLMRQEIANVTAMEQYGESQISEILSYMNDHLEDVTREMVADRFGYSYSYITSILQSATGMTFSNLRKALRLQRAETLLRTTQKSITEIVGDCGFSRSSTLYDLFKEQYGMTPQDYRKSLRQTSQPS